MPDAACAETCPGSLLTAGGPIDRRWRAVLLMTALAGPLRASTLALLPGGGLGHPAGGKGIPGYRQAGACGRDEAQDERRAHRQRERLA